jgi:Outer membrane protein beta-barrel domain
MLFFRGPVLFAALLAAVPSHALATDFYAGVKGGVGLSGFWGANAGDSAGFTDNVRAGFCGGLVGVAQLNENIGLQAELLYAQKGKSSSGDFATFATQNDWKSDYLEIPLLFRLCYPLKGSRVLVYAGPSLSFLLSSTLTVTRTDEGGQQTVSSENTWGTTSAFDAALAVGGGMEFEIPTGEIIFDVRFTPGFVTTDRETGQDKQLDIKNYLVSFMVGYAFKF